MSASADLARAFLADWDPATTRLESLRARYDAGLAWVSRPEGVGGLGASRDDQREVDGIFAAAGFPDNNAAANGIGLGMAAPTIFAVGTDEQKQRLLRPLWTGEEIWCQLFSEPGAGSDLANIATRATRTDGGWIVSGQKVWTSNAHNAVRALLVARTDPDLPKHEGLTYFAMNMLDPGVEVRPLRQLTGEAEFNEVFLTDVFVPDEDLLGSVNDGWRVAMTTLASERVSIGNSDADIEEAMVDVVERTWRSAPQRTRDVMQDRFLRLWVDARVADLTAARMKQQLAAGRPGPEGSALKVTFARLAQELSGLELELLGADGLGYGDWAMVRPTAVVFTGRDAGYRYLRAKGNSIEGGTTEILLNIIAEKVLGLPPEHRPDKGMAWKDSPR
ncbi:MAG: acyl-CoA dehydrogenase family protein [Actinomycetota bacterium]|nr:acyl-CoA dehydrogenase family protein [Actinomycetota bacterium]